MPAHTHPVQANNANADVATPVTPNAGFMWAEADLPDSTLQNVYSPVPAVAMDAGLIVPAQGGAGHDNMQPYLPVNYCISTTGYYPTRP